MISHIIFKISISTNASASNFMSTGVTNGASNVVMEVMVIRLNALDSLAKMERPSLARKRTLFAGAFGAYENLAKETPLIKYSFRSVKPSLFSYLGNYLGYTGYYNPFTGEAQVNTTTPLFVQPFTTCHEIGHQLGYAKENEANFAGFLAARYSDNPAFRYSMYFDMYAYTRSYRVAVILYKFAQLFEIRFYSRPQLCIHSSYRRRILRERVPVRAFPCTPWLRPGKIYAGIIQNLRREFQKIRSRCAFWHPVYVRDKWPATVPGAHHTNCCPGTPAYRVRS